MIKTLDNHLNDFLEEKHSLGYKYKTEYYPILSLINFHKEHGLEMFDDNLIKEWAKKRNTEKDVTYKSRCGDVNQFISFLNRNGYNLKLIRLPRTKRDNNISFEPIILSTTQVDDLFKAINNREYYGSIKKTKDDYNVIFRLLYSTGMRVSELVELRIKDFDTEKELLIIREPKNNQDKLVPLSKTMFNIMIIYHNKYNKGLSDDSHFFRSRFNDKYGRNTISFRFREFLKEANIPHDSELGPRLHDLRHLFCCLSLKQMIKSGKDPYVCLPYLSTYVGHKSIKSTEHYLHLSQFNYEDILSKVNEKFGSVINDDE